MISTTGQLIVENGCDLVFFLTYIHSACVSVANPRELLDKVANPARGLLDREKRTKKGSLAARPLPRCLCLYGVNNTLNSMLVKWTLDFEMDSQEVFGEFESKDSRLRCFVAKII